MASEHKSRQLQVTRSTAALQSLRNSLHQYHEMLGTMTPEYVEPQLYQDWLPAAQQIVQLHLGHSYAQRLGEKTREPIMGVASGGPLGYDFIQAIKDAPAKREWSSRCRNKLQEIAELIEDWENELQANPEKFPELHPAAKLALKMRFDFKLRGALFLAITVALCYMEHYTAPFNSIFKNFTNPWFPEAVLCLTLICLASFILLRKLEWWLGMFGILCTLVVGLMPYVSQPIPVTPTSPSPHTEKLSEPIKQKSSGTKKAMKVSLTTK